MKNIEITNYSSKYNQTFYELNKSWIEEFWMLEDSDLKDLLSPRESIIDLGGEIFFAVKNNLAVGTAAMIPFPNNKIENISKASIKFELDHKRGSLAAILNVVSDCKLNLTKIQSLPKIDTPWVYSFFIDITFDEFRDYEKAKSIMSIMAKDFKILGEYENRKK